ncbi:MAG: hypothetical protein ACLP8A_11295 [Methylovirgula sp.]
MRLVQNILASASVATGCALSTAATLGGGTPAQAETAAWPDNMRARLEILALVETLNGELLASRSATDTLTHWCAVHHMAEVPKIVAHVQPGAQKPLNDEQRRDLDIGPNEPVVYRHVDLACGSHVLSQADNWYVPSRLTPAMNATLQTTTTPFGIVIRPLHPQRRTIAVKFLWQALPQGWEMQRLKDDDASKTLALPALLFQHRALVYDDKARPLSEVVETYTAAILDFPRH